MDRSGGEIDQYDFINAPQYVDFADLAHNDDPNADAFFETHREEDDFLTSIENITPTIQFLSEDNLLYTNENEVNQAVCQAGMDDIKVVYLASPSGNNNRKTSHGRKTSSLNSTVSHYFTPEGEQEDKENSNPSPQYFSPKKLSQSVPQPLNSLSHLFEGLSIDSPIPVTISEDDDIVKEQEQEDSFDCVLMEFKSAGDRKCLSTELEADDRKQSFIVVKDVGQEIVWNQDETGPIENVELEEEMVLNHQDDVDPTENVGLEEEIVLNHQDDVDPIESVGLEEEIVSNPDEAYPIESVGLGEETVSKAVKPKSRLAPTVPYVSKGAVGRQQAGRGPLKASHYVSLAEAITKFQKNTPDRFRTLPRGRIPIKRSSSVDSKLEKRAPSPSPARSPKKVGPNRSRASSVSRTIEKVGPRVAQTYQLNGKVARPIQKTTTIPQPFKLSAAKPKSAMETKTDVPDFKFKARPVPAKILNSGPAGIKERPQAKITLAMAPHFASDDRIRERNEKKSAQSAAHSPTNAGSRQIGASFTKYSRIPTASARVAPEPTKPSTVMKPFSFDQRDQQTLRRKEDKLKKELKEATKIPEFHALVLPSFSNKLPKKRPIPVTNVEPFHLVSDVRGDAYQKALKQKVDEEDRHLKMMATFYANPPIVLHKPAFEPEHSARPPLEHLDFQLNTEKRAVEREHYDQYLRDKEIEEEERRKQEQARLEELQKLEELERRRQIVHKAQPFRHLKQFEPKPSGRALTIPHSPAFNPLPSQRRFTPSKKSDSHSSLQ